MVHKSEKQCKPHSTVHVVIFKSNINVELSGEVMHEIRNHKPILPACFIHIVFLCCSDYLYAVTCLLSTFDTLVLKVS